MKSKEENIYPFWVIFISIVIAFFTILSAINKDFQINMCFIIFFPVFLFLIFILLFFVPLNLGEFKYLPKISLGISILFSVSYFINGEKVIQFFYDSISSFSFNFNNSSRKIFDSEGSVLSSYTNWMFYLSDLLFYITPIYNIFFSYVFSSMISEELIKISEYQKNKRIERTKECLNLTFEEKQSLFSKMEEKLKNK